MLSCAAITAFQSPDAARQFQEGRRALDERRWDEASRALERAVELDRANAEYHLWLGRAYAEQLRRATVARQIGLVQRAGNTLNRAVALDPRSIEARTYLIEFLVRVPVVFGGGAEKAAAHVDSLERLSRYAGAMARARVLVHRGHVGEAEAVLGVLSRNHPDSVAPYARLLNLIDSTRYVDARALAERLEATACCTMLGSYYVARTALLAGGGWTRAERAMRRYLGHRPSDEEPPLAFAHWRLGQILVKQGRETDARAQFEAALRLEPQLASARADLDRLPRR